MSVELIETDTHVFEVEWTPGDEVPGRCRRSVAVRQVGGRPLTGEEWGRVKEAVVRLLIGAGSRVYGVTPILEEPE